MGNQNPVLTIFSWNQTSSWDFVRTEYRPGDALPDVVHNPTTNNSMLYSPLFFSGNTVLLGGDLCLNFIFRMALSALTSQKLMKNWGVQTSGPIPVIMIIPPAFVPRRLQPFLKHYVNPQLKYNSA